MKPTHGGARKGAGRKKTGRTAVTRSVSMPPDVWQAIDKERGEIPRGEFIRGVFDYWIARGGWFQSPDQ